MNVGQLIEVLQQVKNKNMEVCFSYDSRCGGGVVKCVDLDRENNEIYLRDEDLADYEYMCPSTSLVENLARRHYEYYMVDHHHTPRNKDFYFGNDEMLNRHLQSGKSQFRNYEKYYSKILNLYLEIP